MLGEAGSVYREMHPVGAVVVVANVPDCSNNSSVDREMDPVCAVVVVQVVIQVGPIGPNREC